MKAQLGAVAAGVVAEPEKHAPEPIAPLNRSMGLCLIVHDDLELRLRLAGLVRRANPKLDANGISRAGFESLTQAQINSYVAALFIVEFIVPRFGPDPLGNVIRLHQQAPRMPIFVFGRGGDERGAARSIKVGASDYWPVVSVKLEELSAALKPLGDPPKAAKPPENRTEDLWRQPKIAGYRLLKKLAQSYSAAVYLARHDDLEQAVALKVHALRGGQTASDTDRKRFAGECKILSALNHRSIADVLDFGITDEFLYLALEYFPCGSLRDRLRNPASEADAIYYARQIGEALQIVHRARIVHRDLKPSNVMLTGDNRVVLIDFGSARSQLVPSELSQAELSTGTPYYVCPEQIDGLHPDFRGDLYSLGIILYEMLTGTLPYSGDTLAQIFAAHRTASIPRLPERLAHFQPIIDRSMAKSRDDRYASAAEFLEALNAVGKPRQLPGSV
jgi:tRNA A-37 threonylcarbamoyl transferase component Bud32